MDPAGFEPAASCFFVKLQSRRSSGLIYGPSIGENLHGGYISFITASIDSMAEKRKDYIKAFGMALILIAPVNIALYFLFYYLDNLTFLSSLFPYLLSSSFTAAITGAFMLADVYAGSSHFSSIKRMNYSRNCPVCGALVEGDAISCEICSSTLLIRCPRCGMLNRIYARSCVHCGESL
jgi:hypothetical protein